VFELRETSTLRRSVKEISLSLGVEDENKSATGAPDDVGSGSLEESSGAFVLEDFCEAVRGIVVHLLFSTGVHHHSASHGVERIRDNASQDSDSLSESPHDEKVGVLSIREEHGLASVVATEV